MKSYKRDYPRPQLVRDNWMNLNGEWDFCFDDAGKGEAEKWNEAFPEAHRSICVPFTCETLKSGIGDEEHHENLWYRRFVELKESDLEEKRVMLHFEGSDYCTRVWVNGSFVGSHKGGYARFSFDITAFAESGKNEITVKVEDSKSTVQPRGKQRWMKDSYGCWYVQTTGIWKTVWIEYVSPVHLEGLKVTPDLENRKIELVYQVAPAQSEDTCSIESIVSYEGKVINSSCKVINRRKVEEELSIYLPEESPWGIHPWTPENPCLYDLEIRIRKGGQITDEVYSYFGMREIRICEGNILLNNEPLYQRLLLDQGYWKDSHLTPPDEEALIADIEKTRQMGFNGVRKHMKVEDERFLYWCDVKGLLVWSEMAACYEFDDEAMEAFTREWMQAVRQNYNHPSIITWTPFNESWGIEQIKTSRRQQFFTEGIYYLTKSYDSMRPVILNDGWEHTISDILTLHDYEEDGDVFYERYADRLEEIVTGRLYHNKNKSAFADGFAYKGQPVIISEYGGIAFSGGEKGSWGYGRTVSNEQEFLDRFDKITAAIKKIPYIKGYCYTQVSDVQQEINGLLDADHAYKLPPEKIREVNLK